MNSWFFLYNWQGLSLSDARLGFLRCSDMCGVCFYKVDSCSVKVAYPAKCPWSIIIEVWNCFWTFWLELFSLFRIFKISETTAKNHLRLVTARPCPIYANCPSHNHTLTHKNTHFKTLSPQPGPAPVRAIGMYRRLMKITSRAFISSNTTERRVCTQEIFDLN